MRRGARRACKASGWCTWRRPTWRRSGPRSRPRTGPVRSRSGPPSTGARRPHAVPQPAVGALDARPLAPAAPRRHRRSPTTSGSTTRSPATWRSCRLTAPRCWWRSPASGRASPHTTRARSLRDPRRHGPRRVPRPAIPTPTEYGAATTTPTRTSWRSGCSCARCDALDVAAAPTAPDLRRAARPRPRSWRAGSDISRRDARRLPRRRRPQPVRGLRASWRSSTGRPTGSRYGTSTASTASSRPRATAPTATRLSKQADVLMLFYLLRRRRAALSCSSGWATTSTSRPIPRASSTTTRATSHGSTLSGVVNTWVLARANRDRVVAVLQQALKTRRRGHPGRHHLRGHPPRRDGRHRRPPAAMLHGHRAAR